MSILFFRPWVLDPATADPHVPHVSDLRGADETWREAWVRWCDGGVLTQRSKQTIVMFQSVFAVRQEEDLPEDDKRRDSSIVLSGKERQAALHTAMRQQRRSDGTMGNDTGAETSFQLVQEAVGSNSSDVYDERRHVASTFEAPASSSVTDILKATRESQKQKARRLFLEETRKRSSSPPMAWLAGWCRLCRR